MRKIVLYEHSGSKNHGCEAIVRSTLDLLELNNYNSVLISFNSNEDIMYGVNKIIRLVQYGETRKLNKRFSMDFMKAYLKIKISNNHNLMDCLAFSEFCGLKRNDIALSIGGDTYCYDNYTYIFRDNEQWRLAGLKTVLWGCSIEPNLLKNDTIANDIKKFDLITARESITYEAVKKINPNTKLVCDSAFYLKKDVEKLPKNKYIGINLSPLVLSCENDKGIVMSNYHNLINYIIHKTDFDILLIPHVLKGNLNNDEILLKELYDKFKNTNRVLLIHDENCCVLKGYISQCSYFVGARTHATIAAYSECVPTLVIGYSVKAKGIAKDLFGTHENYVLSAQNLTSEYDLVNSFIWLMKNSDSIKKRLRICLPNYKKRIFNGIESLYRL